MIHTLALEKFNNGVYMAWVSHTFHLMYCNFQFGLLLSRAYSAQANSRFSISV